MTYIAWEQTGEGEPVLLVMGHAYPRGMWHRVVPALAAEFRVIWFDNRGVGESDRPPGPYTIAEMAADAVGVLDAASVDTAHVYGVSMGGLIAQEIALSHPTRVRTLILGCTGAMSDDKVGNRKSPAWMYRLPRRLVTRLGVPLSYGPNRSRAKVAEDLAIQRAQRITPHSLAAQSQATNAYRSLDRVASIRAPTLVLHGESDRIVKPEWGRELADAIPGATLITYPGAGHNFLTDATEQANADVIAFLRSHAGSTVTFPA